MNARKEYLCIDIKMERYRKSLRGKYQYERHIETRIAWLSSIDCGYNLGSPLVILFFRVVVCSIWISLSFFLG